MPLIEDKDRVELHVSFPIKHKAIAQTIHALCYEVLGILEWSNKTERIETVLKNTVPYIRMTLEC